MIPGVYDTCSNMFAFWGDLFVVGSFLDVDGKLLIGPEYQVSPLPLPLPLPLLIRRNRDSLTWYVPYHERQP